MSLVRSCNIICNQQFYLILVISGIPFGIWLAFWRDMQLHGLWIGLTVSLVCSAAVGIWICLCTDWNREVEKVRTRLEADRKHANGHPDPEGAH